MEIANKRSNCGRNLSRPALGHEQTSRHVRVMSVIPLKADIHHCGFARPLSANNGHLAPHEVHFRVSYLYAFMAASWSLSSK